MNVVHSCVVLVVSVICVLGPGTDRSLAAQPRDGAPPARLLARIDSLTIAYQTDSAQKIIDSVLPSARAQADSSLLLSLLVRRGRLPAYFSRGREAEPYLTEAVSLAEALRDSANLCVALRWLAVATDAEGRRAEARRIDLRLRDIARAIRDPKSEGWASLGLAWEAEQDGLLDEASRLYHTALDLFSRSAETLGGIWVWNGLGSVEQRKGNLRAATTDYRESMRLSVQAKYTNGELRALNNLGTVEFLRGDPAAALESFRRACELQTRTGNLREAVTPALNVAVCQTYLGRYREAEEVLQQNLAICAPQDWKDLEFVLTNQLARVKSLMGAHGDAARLYRQCLARESALPLKTRALVAIGLSSELSQMDSSAAGLAVMDDLSKDFRDRMTGELEVQLQGARGLLLLEMGFPAGALPLFRAADAGAARFGLAGYRVEALSNAAAAYRALAMPDSNLAVLERACRIWETERTAPTSPDWRESRGATGHMIFTDLAAALLARAGPCTDRDRIADAFDRLQIFKARTLLERMRGPEAMQTGAARPEDDGIIRIETLQRDVLEPGEVFLDCYVGPQRSLVFAVTRDEARWAAMPAESMLTPRVERFREILTEVANSGDAGGAAAIGRTAACLDSILFGGIAEIVRGRERIFVAADGPLHTMPFGLAAAMGPARGDAGAPVAPARWVRIPSATVLSVLRASERAGLRNAPKRILALSGGGAPEGGDLPGARDEVRAIADAYRGIETRLPAPPAGDVRDWRALESYDLIHVASHTRLLDRAPWQSEIEFGEGPESSLPAGRICTLRLRASLVVLSSCESAGGGILSGEGVAGLTSAFIAAGVPTVVATLWPVDDRVTARFMDHFYAALAEGLPVGGALSSAQAAIRRNAATQAPFYWAGFVLVGNDRVAENLERKGPPTAWFVITGLALLVAVSLAILFGWRRLHARNPLDVRTG